MATDDKPTEEEIKELEAQIKHDQEKPVAETRATCTDWRHF